MDKRVNEEIVVRLAEAAIAGVSQSLESSHAAFQQILNVSVRAALEVADDSLDLEDSIRKLRKASDAGIKHAEQMS